MKLWLSNDRRAAHFDKKIINKLLKDIEDSRKQMTHIMMKIIRSKKEKELLLGIKDDRKTHSLLTLLTKAVLQGW